MKTIKLSVFLMLAAAALFLTAFSAAAAEIHVSTMAELRGAAENATGEINIIMDNDLTYPYTDTEIYIPSGANVSVASAEGRTFTLQAHQSSHFYVSKNAALTVSNIILDGWSHNAGGITNSGILTVDEGTVITKCDAQFGSIENSGGTVHINGAEIIDNVIDNYNSEGAAGIFNMEGTVTITNSKISGNRAIGHHLIESETVNGIGGIANFDTMILTDCEISNNTTIRTGNCGGIFVAGPTTITNCRITGNSAESGSGGIYLNSWDISALTVTDTVFSGNTAENARWMTDPIGIVIHNRQITGATQFSAPPEGNKPFEYAYNNYDIFYFDGLTENPLPENTYTIRFVDWDGTVLDEQTVDEGAAAVAPPDPKRGGYWFTGWDKAFETVMEDMTITALYEPNFSVSFEDEGANVSISNDTDAPLQGMLVLAVYSQDGSLTTSESVPFDLEVNSYGLFFVPFPLNDVPADDYTCKLFIWDQSLVPLTEAFVR